MVIVIMTSNNRVTQHCIRYGKRCSCRAGSKTCPRDPSQVMELRNIFHNHPDGNPDPSFTSREGGIGGDMNVLHYYDQLYPDNHINYAIYTLYAGTWGYYPYDKNTKPDAIRGKQTELPEIFVPGKRR